MNKLLAAELDLSSSWHMVYAVRAMSNMPDLRLARCRMHDSCWLRKNYRWRWARRDLWWRTSRHPTWCTGHETFWWFRLRSESFFLVI